MDLKMPGIDGLEVWGGKAPDVPCMSARYLRLIYFNNLPVVGGSEVEGAGIVTGLVRGADRC